MKTLNFILVLLCAGTLPAFADQGPVTPVVITLVAQPFLCSDGKTYSVVHTKNVASLNERDGLLYEFAAFCADGIVTGEVNSDKNASPTFATCSDDRSAATKVCFDEFEKLGNILISAHNHYYLKETFITTALVTPDKWVTTPSPLPSNLPQMPQTSISALPPPATFAPATPAASLPSTPVAAPPPAPTNPPESSGTRLASCQILSPGKASGATQTVAVTEQGVTGHVTDGPFGLDVEGVQDEDYRIKLSDSSTGFVAEGQIDALTLTGFVQILNLNGEVVASASCKLN
jgi:hypothetical protein